MQQKKSVLIGTMITAGSAVGAGMFSLPIVSAGMWFSLAIISFVVIWLISYLSSLLILEISLEYPIGSSFNTFVMDILGKGWSVVMGLSICFMLYILLYAYFSAFGNIAMHTLGWEIAQFESQWTQGALGFSLGMLLAAVVWMSTAFVGRVSILLVVAMAISFVIAMSGAFADISVSNLFISTPQGESRFAYVWSGLPYFMTSFAFATIVPSLYKYYGKDVPSIKRSLLFGSLIALLIYSIWISINFGIIPREAFVAINEAGGNVGDLISALEQRVGNSSIQAVINFFSNIAIISSFLGVGLSLFDYIADRFTFADTVKGRLVTACITFIPPGIASFFFPHGFIAAIGFAGVVLFIGLFLIPFLMVWKLRATSKSSAYRLAGGKPVLLLILLMSSITVVCHVLVKLDLLPSF